MPAEDDDNGAGNEDRHEGRRHRVGEEILDQLDVVGGDADEIAGAPPHEIGGRQRSSFRKARCASRSSKRYAMSWAIQDSTQWSRPASGATTASAITR